MHTTIIEFRGNDEFPITGSIERFAINDDDSIGFYWIKLHDDKGRTSVFSSSAWDIQIVGRSISFKKKPTTPNCDNGSGSTSSLYVVVIN